MEKEKTLVKENVKDVLAFPFSVSTMENLCKAVGARFNPTPKAVFCCMLDKKICSDEMVKAMFGLSDEYLRLVFTEDHDVFLEENVRWILEQDFELDKNTGRRVQIPLTPAQGKFRKMLVKVVNVGRFEVLMGCLEEEYGVDVLDDYFYEVEEENTITEEELLDALCTYQSEHGAE